MTVALTSFQLVPCTHELVATLGFQLVFQLVRLVEFGLIQGHGKAGSADLPLKIWC